ncbi:MAG: leucyl aminopeptidase [Gammaproteobacteria bacterium]|nr:leucyl aminopeptidase [Gammaproteobacteria bacterium]
MDISVRTVDPTRQRSECYIVAVYDEGSLSPSGTAIDKYSAGTLSKLLKRGDMAGRSGQKQFLYDLPGIAASRVLLVGCGKLKPLSDTQYRTLIGGVIQYLNDAAIKEAVCFLAELEVETRDSSAAIRLGSEVVVHQTYRFSQLKSDKNPSQPALKKFTWHVAQTKQLTAASKAARIGKAIGQGMALTRDLGNLPGNICTPAYLAQTAKKLGRTHGMQVRVLEQKHMQALGMGSLLSVSRGSRQPPKLITLDYRGAKKPGNPVALVGKGITFDAGGISIKPAAAMDEMKFDMCGAASVLGTLQAAAELKLPINIIGVIPSCENLPDGDANKPGDIVTSMSGQTIEVLNTDAEGRLILCDALTYTERFKPKAVIDIATLTGACVIALGNQASGLLGNDQALIDKLLRAGKHSADRAWQLPLWEEYQEQLKSNFADMANIGGREAGTITAACFLSRFTKKFKWAHLDIAGVAWYGGASKGASGRPVSLLTHYLIEECDY